MTIVPHLHGLCTALLLHNLCSLGVLQIDDITIGAAMAAFLEIGPILSFAANDV